MEYTIATNLSGNAELRVGELEELDPIEFPSKKDRRKWAERSDTKWCFYSLSFAEDPQAKPSKANPIQFLGGLIADYDNYEIDDATIERAIEKSKENGFPPTRAHITPSGGVRFIWEFEEKIPLPGKEFFKLAKQLLKADDLLPSLDQMWSNPYMLYDYGYNWVQIGEPIALSRVLELWDKTYQRPKGFRSVELEDAGREAEARWPGRWKGSWHEGARGCRFWIEGADATSVLLTATGCVCFTGGKSFIPWAEIFGAEWVETHSANNIGDIIQDWVQDDTTGYYWLRDQEPSRYSVEQVKRILEMSYGLDRSRVEGSPSEIDEVLHAIDRSRRVSAIGELPFHPYGMIRHHERMVWNSYHTPVALAEPGDCQALLDFFTQLFCSEFERDLVFSWAKLTYESLRDKKMTRAQVLFIVGPPHTGKNLISEKIFVSMFGRGVPAGNYLAKGDPNNGNIVASPYWFVNDVTLSGGIREKNEMMSRIKDIAANTEVTVREKYKVSFVQSLAPRLLVTCNETPDALSILPTADRSAIDKLLITRVSPSANTLFDKPLLTALIQQIPAFCDWLCRWKIPENIQANNRFGMVPYFNPELLEMAKEDTAENIVSHLIQTWVEGQGKNYKEVPITSLDLYMALMERDDIAGTLRGVVGSASSFGRLLSSCSHNSTNTGIVKVRDQKGAYRFRVTRMKSLETV